MKTFLVACQQNLVLVSNTVSYTDRAVSMLVMSASLFTLADLGTLMHFYPPARSRTHALTMVVCYRRPPCLPARSRTHTLSNGRLLLSSREEMLESARPRTALCTPAPLGLRVTLSCPRRHFLCRLTLWRGDACSLPQVCPNGEEREVTAARARATACNIL
jgi:hypothetical protein